MIDISKTNPNNRVYKVMSVILGGILIITGIVNLSIINLLIGILLLFYSTYNKKVFLLPDGLVSTYTGFLFKQTDKYDLKSVKEVDIIIHGSKGILFFMKDEFARKVEVDNKQIDEINLFLKKHTDIKVKIKPQ
ncbi:hypothetical protein [Natronincola ferrireducens]|nr:hypothetical protein [Natronincola ferrireducens]